MGKQNNPDSTESSIALKWELNEIIDKPYNELFKELTHLEQLVRGYPELNNAVIIEDVESAGGRSMVNSVKIYTERSILTNDSVIEKILRPINRITCQTLDDLDDAKIFSTSIERRQPKNIEYRLSTVVFYNYEDMPDVLNQRFRQSIQCGVGQLGLQFGDILYDDKSGAIEVEIAQPSCTVKEYKNTVKTIKQCVSDHLSDASPTQTSIMSRALDGGTSTDVKVTV